VPLSVDDGDDKRRRHAMSTNSSATAFRASFDACKEVTARCPVRATTLGYYPILGLNAFFAAGFGLAALVALFFGVRKRTWGYSLAVAAGCILECAGYIGRALLAKNPWNSDAFKLQITAIVLGPTLICVGLYLTLKHLTTINPALSRLAPRWYPLVFVPADVSCLVIQAIGGGMAAAAKRDKPEMANHGNRMIIAGIVLQVVVLGAFGSLSSEYLFRVKRWAASVGGDTTPDTARGLALWRDKKFRIFVWGMTGAYVTLMLRCIYRIAEMAGGWGNHIMQDEVSFIVLESFMVLIASVLLAVIAPGVFVPEMWNSGDTKGVAEKGTTDGESEGTELEKSVRV